MSSPPIARSPIHAAGPVEINAGWEVSAIRSTAPLRLADRTPMAKVLLRAPANGQVAARLGVPFGQAQRDEHGTLVVGSGPGEWLLIGAVGSEEGVTARIDAEDDGLVTVLDYTHGRALMRLTGEAAADTLAKLCPINLADAVTPNGSAFRSVVAHLATDVVRDDLPDDAAGTRSYLLHCERSSGQYLFDTLLDAGDEFGIEPDGLAYR